jgi:hypothetical protein
MSKGDFPLHAINNWEFYDDEIKWKGKTVLTVKDAKLIKWLVILGAIGAFIGGISTAMLVFFDALRYFNGS